MIIIHFNISSISGGGGGGSHFRGSSCRNGNCGQVNGIIAGSIIGGVIGLILLILGTIFCCRYWNGRPFRKNPAFVRLSNSKQTKSESHGVDIFRSGIWASQYHQYRAWHGPDQLSLSFDPQSMKVTGSGSDNIGTFTIDGVYSTTTHRMGLTKKYQSGTGNPSENLGHEVTIQLAWNEQNHQFEGKWFVQTTKYRGDGKFELKFDEKHFTNAYEKA